MRIGNIKKALTKEPKPKEVDPSSIPTKDLLSTGYTPLNLALSSRRSGGLAKGQYYHLVGDSDTGKTFLILTLMAEASINKNFEGYSFVLDAPEEGNLMNIEKFFGKELANRLEMVEPSESLEDFWGNLYKRLKDGSCIYALDSLDALSSKEEKVSFDAEMNGEQVKGTYGTGRARANSQKVRRVLEKLHSSGSILIIVSQTRDSIGKFVKGKTYSGGNALKFFCALQLWTSLREKIKKTVNGKLRQLGIRVKISIRKNRMSGKEWDVEMPIYWSVGIDDLGGCVSYLLEEKHWVKGKGGIKCPEWNKSFKNEEEVVRYVESEGLETDLRSIVGKVFRKIESQCSVNRKNKYE